MHEGTIRILNNLVPWAFYPITAADFHRRHLPEGALGGRRERVLHAGADRRA
ncbi:MAG: hypothetical protein IPJ27_19755 [Candidatus Accumulibacter sp.]|uniref:Uncharacterized protein n=1 Tax=Candidatus Accumulibacter proximus TaxID=2954385 RepID=A0A935Q0K2_9PROT|nr:hypothetical protein [Candidatus Accumulibacter proximus]